jgi:hypothetical protein
VGQAWHSTDALTCTNINDGYISIVNITLNIVDISIASSTWSGCMTFTNTSSTSSMTSTMEHYANANIVGIQRVYGMYSSNNDNNGVVDVTPSQWIITPSVASFTLISFNATLVNGTMYVRLSSLPYIVPLCHNDGAE